jgi:antitoxin ParD1/3/4
MRLWQKGLADVEGGRVKPLAEVAERLKAKYRRMAEESGE